MNLNNAIARAQRMMLSEDFNNQVEFAARQQGGKGGTFSSTNDLAALEAQAFGAPNVSAQIQGSSYQGPTQRGGMIPQNTQIQMLQETPEVRDLSGSKLPPAVLKSLKEMPPIEVDEGLAGGIPASYFGNIGAHQQVISEQVQPRQSYSAPAPQPTAGVDYNYLKYLIQESVANAIKSLNEGSNMSVFKGMKISDGGKIQFLDNKGNLYEGILTFKKKVTK